MKTFYIECAELVGNSQTEEKCLRYNGKQFTLTNKDWEAAEEEAKELLEKMFPNKKIHIR